MSISNQFFSEKLIEDYVKIPPTLKELVNTKLAIQLCQNFQFKKRIIDSQWLYREWERRIGVHSSDLCETLVLPRALKVPLINRIWLIANRMFSWNSEHKEKLSMNSRHTADQSLTYSDWTVEGRINKEKIAKRLVQDERIPVYERYRIACVNILVPFIHRLWNQIPLENRKEFMDAQYYEIHQQSLLVRLWSYRMVGRLEEWLGHENLFWQRGLLEAVKEGQKTAVIYFWNALSESMKQIVIVEIAERAWRQYHCVRNKIRNSRHSCFFHMCYSSKWCAMPTDYSDILYFLVSQMSGEQMVQFFESLYDSIHYRDSDAPISVFTWLIESPHQRYFIPIITKLWDILPKRHYVELLRELSARHENIRNKEEYKDYNYGNLLIDLLKRTPEEYYRYIFEIYYRLHAFFSVIRNPTKSIDIIENMLNRATVKEMQTLMYSSFGTDFCYFLIKWKRRETMDLILADCLPKKKIADFKKRFLLSYRAREVCFGILARENGESVNSLLNWGHLSEEEISDFKLKLIWEVLEDRKPIYSWTTDFLETYSVRILERGLSRWNPKDAIIDLLKRFDIESVDRILEWCLPFEDARKPYKDQLSSILRKEKFTFHESILCSEFNLKRFILKISQFLIWAFPSEVDRKHFKMKLFAEGYPRRILRKSILHEQWQDVDTFIELFELSPENVKQLKKDVMWAADTLYSIFDLLYKSDSDTVSHYLNWGLSDSVNLKAFIDRFNDFICEDIDRVKRNWDQLIKDRLSHLAVVLPEEKRGMEKVAEG